MVFKMDKIRQFKSFINNHPKLLEYVRKNGYSWQDYYEKWIMLGEEDSYWDTFRDNPIKHSRNTTSSEGVLHQLEYFVTNMDVPKVQKQVSELNKIIETINGLLKRYLESKASKTSSHYDFFQKYKD